ncbi:unnamed protein product [Callosobruchus maculatus]|uniref:Protein NDNF n=1 Tax=Callosobruchus maculatus TaxID=64391 RepID=A0A653DU13_CALMS|nr:unnamed protein product [Callosobruchus maculatus]
MKDCRALVGMRRGGRRIKAGKAERNGSDQQIVVAPETVNSGGKTRVDAVPYVSRTPYAKLARENAYSVGVKAARVVSHPATMLIVRRRLFLLLMLFIKLTESNRKNRRYKELRRPEVYDVIDSDYLPSDIQVTSYLYKEVTKRTRKPLVTSGINTTYLAAMEGLYMLQLRAQETDTYIHIYVSTEDGGPKTIQSARLHKMRIIQRQRRKGVTLRWQPSLVDPQSTTYCVVVHDQRNYGSLCAAQADKFGDLPPTNRPVAASQTVIDWHPINNVYPIIACVGRSTQYTTLNLKQGKNYYFEVFATDRQNNFTYPYASTSIVFDGKIKPIRLKNGVSAYASLRKYDGKVVFRYKIPKKPGKHLKLIFIPCGSVVYVEVSQKGNVIVAKRNVMKYENVTIDSPIEGSRYYIKVLASTKPLPRAFLPAMPSTTSLNEYQSLRTCDSVTIGWLPVPGRTVSHYCISAREGELEQVNNIDRLYQCPAKNSKLKKADDYVLKYCKDIAHSDKAMATLLIEH